MKTSTIWSKGLLLLTVSFLVLLTISGCKKDDNPVDNSIKPITDDLFPLTPNRQLVYNGFLRDPATDQNITAYTAYQAKWTVFTNAAPLPAPYTSTSNLIWDSTLVPTGVLNPPVIWIKTPFFIKRNPSTGSSNFSFLQNIASFYRKVGLGARTDTLRWIDLAQLDKGVDNEFTAFDSTWSAGQGNVRLQVVGQFTANVSITVNGQNFNTYKLATRRKVYLGGALSSESESATIWLAPNIGPVKMIINADGENYGHFRELVSKNF